MEEAKKIKRRILITLIILPIIIAFFVVSGVFLGFYVAEASGSRGAIAYPLIFSTLGLAASIGISYIIAKKVSTPRG